MEDVEKQYSNKRGVAELWAGVMLAPTAWAIQFMLAYSLVRVACDQGSNLLLYAVRFTFLVPVAAGAWFAWRSFDRTGRAWPGGDEDGVLVRSRFMAVSGLLLSALFALLMFAELIPMLLLNPCQ